MRSRFGALASAALASLMSLSRDTARAYPARVSARMFSITDISASPNTPSGRALA
jgi:hypothetical protein